MAKFQPLILPGVLWALTCLFLTLLPPDKPLVICTFILLVFFALLLSMRLTINKSYALILSGCAGFFLISSWLFGFSFLNTVLIFALGILLCVSVK